MLTSILVYFILLPAMLLFFLAALACGIVSLSYQGIHKQKWIDLLLLTTTILIATTFVADHFAKTMNTHQSGNSLTLGYRARATFLTADLTAAAYARQLPELNPILSLGAVEHPFKDDVDQAYQLFYSLLRQHPHDAMLVERCAITCHESGRDAAAFLLPERSANNQTINSLFAIYSGQADRLDKDKIEALLTTTLPAGWFQESALLCLYKNGPMSKLQNIEAQSKLLAHNWDTRYLVHRLANLIFALIGIAFLSIFARQAIRPELPAFPNYGFRAVYGCFLVFLCSQLMAAFTAGLFFAIARVLLLHFNHSQLHVEGISFWVQAAAVTSSVVFCFVAVHYFICLPMGTSLLSLLKANKLSIRQLIITAFGGFCAVVALVNASTWLSHFLLIKGHARDLDLQVIDQALSDNHLFAAGTILAACLLIPIVEELLFRGLLYPWLRKFCIWPVAIAINACLFALCHNSPAHFLSYCALAIVLALVYEKKRNLPAVIGIHCLWNAWFLISAVSLLPR